MSPPPNGESELGIPPSTTATSTCLFPEFLAHNTELQPLLMTSIGALVAIILALFSSLFVMEAFEASLQTFPKKLFVGLQAGMMAKSYPITSPHFFYAINTPPSVKSNNLNCLGKINKA